ncbi:MAG TPA: patatin-like phospholipase family protein [Casimicrobiaceae bacterium]|nr:patatin-like phospholipase family protein [Casimicrobiaceae bacterium]
MAAPPSQRSRRNKPPRVNLALQGGGAHGAFSWGVLDWILETGCLDIEGISGTSAGSMNAVVFAYGKCKGGAEYARELLETFWREISNAGNRHSVLRHMPWLGMLGGSAAAFEWLKALTHAFSPYQLNPANFNPLREVLAGLVDFDALRACRDVSLFLTATNVRTGKPRVFHNAEITADVVMASACLPQLFQAVEIDGDPYWDGGYMGNPSLYPLFYHTHARDVIILHINPIEREGTPRSGAEIFNRVNEIAFNASLIKELRAIAFVQKLRDEGALKDEFAKRYKYVLIHSIRADRALADLSVETKFESDWGFLTELRDRGRATAAEWYAANARHIGVRSSVDLQSEFLTSGTELEAQLGRAPAAARKQS